MEIIVFILICYGFSNQFKFSAGPFSIYDKIKVRAFKINVGLYNLLDCLMCLPTWVGIILSIINMTLIETPFTPMNILCDGDYNIFGYLMFPILDGFIASGTTYMLATIQQWFEYGGEDNEEDDNEKELIID